MAKKYAALCLTRIWEVGEEDTIGNEEFGFSNFIEGQWIQWLDHILRREEDDHLRVYFEWKPVGKRPRGRPRKRWIDRVTEDLNAMGMQLYETEKSGEIL